MQPERPARLCPSGRDTKTLLHSCQGTSLQGTLRQPAAPQAPNRPADVLPSEAPSPLTLLLQDRRVQLQVVQAEAGPG